MGSEEKEIPKPQALCFFPGLPFENFFYAHQPIWDDCQQLLAILFIVEEQDRIPLGSRKLTQGLNSRILPHAKAQMEQTFLSSQPN